MKLYFPYMVSTKQKSILSLIKIRCAAILDISLFSLIGMFNTVRAEDLIFIEDIFWCLLCIGSTPSKIIRCEYNDNML